MWCLLIDRDTLYPSFLHQSLISYSFVFIFRREASLHIVYSSPPSHPELIPCCFFEKTMRRKQSSSHLDNLLQCSSDTVVYGNRFWFPPWFSVGGRRLVGCRNTVSLDMVSTFDLHTMEKIVALCMRSTVWVLFVRILLLVLDKGQLLFSPWLRNAFMSCLLWGMWKINPRFLDGEWMLFAQAFLIVTVCFQPSGGFTHHFVLSVAFFNALLLCFGSI